MMEDDERTTELEIKISYLEQRLESLDATVVEQSRRIDELERLLAAVKAALRRVREGGDAGDVLGAYPEEDPVPRSG